MTIQRGQLRFHSTATLKADLDLGTPDLDIRLAVTAPALVDAAAIVVVDRSFRVPDFDRILNSAHGGSVGFLARPRLSHFFANVPPFCRYVNFHTDLRRGASLQTTRFFLQTGRSCKLDGERGVVHVDNRSMWIIDGKVAAPLG